MGPSAMILLNCFTSFFTLLSTLTATSTFSLILLLTSSLFSSVPVAGDESDVIQVKVRSLKPSDYELGPSFTKEFSLVGKDKKSEKLRGVQVWQAGMQGRATES